MARPALRSRALAAALALGGIALVAAPAASAGERRLASPLPPAPMVLPGSAAAAAGGSSASGTWLVGGVPGPATRRIARQHGATTVVAQAGAYSVPRRRARAFAAALERAGTLAFAEPDRLIARTAYPSDPFSQLQQNTTVVDPSLTPPAIGPDSPMLAVIDSQVDLSHPELAGGNVRTPTSQPLDDPHGTAVTSVAAAPADGRGMAGIWPGMPVLALDPGDSCGPVSRAVGQAVDAGAAVLNMSYAFEGRGCFAHTLATQIAFGRGMLLVAAAGNEFQQGNPTDRYPAADPHVLTVGAVSPQLDSSVFSNRNVDVDLSAPGEAVLTAVPPALDADGIRDGFELMDGTSFASPMVAAATSWVIAERPGLDRTQVFDLMRYSTRDLGERGFDPDFGFGLLDLAAALRDRPPGVDPSEPNDDIPWIDGTVFAAADDPIFAPGSGPARLGARIDATEDPVDVYRVVVPGRSRLRIAIRPRFGDPDLSVFSRAARTVNRRRGLIARSIRGPGRLDAVTLVTRGRRRTAYVAVNVGSASVLTAGYRLTVRRR